MADTHELSADEILAEVGWMRSLAFSLVRDEAAAEDLVQETWVAALRRPPDPTRPLRPWLATVLGNFARMRMRAGSTRARREQATARSEALPDSSELVERMETQRVLAQRVLDLEEPYRSTVLLRYYEGLSAAEIARRTNTPAGTVRWRLNVALKTLREKLDEGHDGDRESWCRLLLPLAGAPFGPPSTSPAAPLPAPAVPWGAWSLGAAGLLALSAAVWVGFGILGAPDRAGPGDGVALLDESLAPAAGEGALAPLGPRTTRGPVGVLRSSAPDEELFAVSARAVDPHGLPLESALLSLEGERGTRVEAWSDPDGVLNLRWDALAPGAPLRLHLQAPDRVPRELPCDVAELERGVAYELGELVLEPAGAIEGRVHDADGAPRVGVAVALEPLASRWQSIEVEPLAEARLQGSLLGDSAPVAFTDEGGVFRFDAVEVGFVRLWTRAEDAFSEHSAPIAVRAGTTSDAGILALEQPAEEMWLAGRVLGPDGRGVAFAELECARHSTRSFFFQDEAWVFPARADEDGFFRALVGSYPNYDVAARDPGGDLSTAVLRKVPTGSHDLVLELAPSDRLAVLVLASDGALLPEPAFEWADRDRGKTFAAELAEAPRSGEPAGAAALLNVPARAAFLRVAHRGYGTREVGPFLAGAAPESLRVELEPAPQLSGTLLDAGADAAGALVAARVELLRELPAGTLHLFPQATATHSDLAAFIEPTGSSTFTDARASFALDLDRAGTYWVRVETTDGRTAFSGPHAWAPALGSFAREVSLAPVGALAGRVTSSDGRALAGRVLGVSRGDGYVRSVRVAADGAYRFDALAPGDWQLVELRPEAARGPWSALGEIDAGYLDPAAGACASNVRIESGAVATLDLDLARPSSVELRGRLSVDGVAPGAWIVVLARAGLERGVDAAPLICCLDPDGRFAFALPRAGRYSLELRPIGESPDPTRILDELQLDIGLRHWELALGTGRLTIEHVAPFDARAASYERYHVWEGGGELVAVTRLSGDAEQRCVIARAPSGPSRIVAAPRAPQRGVRANPRHGDTLLELELETGGRRTVRLP